MVARKKAAATPPHIVERLLGACDDSDVLVGGQALTVWVVKFGLTVPARLPVITHDADFLTQSPAARDTVRKFAQAIDGTPRFPRKLALTALVGQVELEVPDGEYLNVDIIFQVIGLDARKVLERAIQVTFGASRFQVMHPFDVLRSRLANLHQLQEKQNEKGALQLAMAIQVARKFLQSEAALIPPSETATGRSPLQTLVSEIEHLALSDAGRKVAARWGQHVADAIDPSLIPAGPFWSRKWPTLRALMSAGHAARFTPPG